MDERASRDNREGSAVALRKCSPAGSQSTDLSSSVVKGVTPVSSDVGNALRTDAIDVAFTLSPDGRYVDAGLSLQDTSDLTNGTRPQIPSSESAVLRATESLSSTYFT